MAESPARPTERFLHGFSRGEAPRFLPPTLSSSAHRTMLLRAAALSASRRRHRIGLSSSGSSSSSWRAALSAAGTLPLSLSPSSSTCPSTSAPFSSTTMPPCSFAPPPYTGPSASEVLRLRKEHLSPGEWNEEARTERSRKRERENDKEEFCAMPPIFSFPSLAKTTTRFLLHSDVPPLQGAHHDHRRAHAVPF